MAQISIINTDSLEGSSRIDAEYYQPLYREASDSVRKGRYKSIGELGQVLRGKTPKDYVEKGAPVIRAVDLRDITNSENFLFASPAEDLFYLKKGDVLISSIGAGSIGKVGVFSGDSDCATVSEVSVIRLWDYSPKVLGAFLQTKFGYLQLEQRITGSTGQLHLYPKDIVSIVVPIFTPGIQARVEKAYEQSSQALVRSRQLYSEAQQAVLDRVDFLEPDATKKLFYVANANEVKLSGRLDAEYYQPLFRAAFKKTMSIAPQTVELGNLCKTLTNGHTPLRHRLDEGEVTFLTAEHIHDFRVDLTSNKRILTEHHEKELKRTALRSGDILVTIKGKVGNAAIVPDLGGPTNINQDVALIRLESGIDADFLCAFLNSPLGKLLSERMSTNQINPFLGLGNLSKIPIPLFEESKMNEVGKIIRETISKARQAEEKAKSLIAEAIQTVEDFIEKSA